jgi:ubiquinone/menaquinone biosynthesis C-methylase UbiE
MTPIDDHIEYQRDFSSLHPETMFDEAGRLRKARKTVAVLIDAADRIGLEPARARVLDIGCSTGILSQHYSEAFHSVVGVDIDDGAIEWARANRAADNLEYRVGDSMDLPVADAAIEIVTCTHIYEHVPDAQRMVDEIFRVLRPGGLCYFAAENRLRPWDGHYDLPLVTVLPKPMADLMVRFAGRGEQRYETHLSVWGLRELVRRFEIMDYTAEVARDPERFEATEMIAPGSMKQRLALATLAVAYWAFPTYLWVLRKPEGD